MRALAVLTVRNEAAFLLEWLAHHRAIGFTDFLVFSNDCDDGTDAMLDRLAEMGQLSHVPNPGPYDQRGIQFSALQTASNHPLFRNADWAVALDIDEFVNIHAGDGRLPDLWAALPKADAITLTWRLFGNAGHLRYVDAPVTETFTQCAPVVLYWPWRSAMFKTLFRADRTYRKLGVHRPRSPDPDRVETVRWFDGEGRELDADFRKRRIFSPYGRSNYALAQLNHYPLGAMESFVLKADRGRAVHSEHILGLDYWIERNFNVDTDTSILRMAPARDAVLDELKADAVLSRLHDEAVAWRRARFEELMLHEPFRALLGRLMMAPPTRPISQRSARMLHLFATRARELDVK